MTDPLTVTLALVGLLPAGPPAGAGLERRPPPPASPRSSVPPRATGAKPQAGPVPGTVVYRSSFGTGATDGWSTATGARWSE